MSSDFDTDEYIEQRFADELAEDLRFETALALRCAASVAIVVLLVVVRQIWLV